MNKAITPVFTNFYQPKVSSSKTLTQQAKPAKQESMLKNTAKVATIGGATSALTTIILEGFFDLKTLSKHTILGTGLAAGGYLAYKKLLESKINKIKMPKELIKDTHKTAAIGGATVAGIIGIMGTKQCIQNKEFKLLLAIPIACTLGSIFGGGIAATGYLAYRGIKALFTPKNK